MRVIQKYLGEKVMEAVVNDTKVNGKEKKTSVINTIDIVHRRFDEKTRNAIYLIKVMERMHNLQTMSCFSPEKQERLKEETIEEILPMAIDLSLESCIQEILLLTDRYSQYVELDFKQFCWSENLLKSYSTIDPFLFKLMKCCIENRDATIIGNETTTKV